MTERQYFKQQLQQAGIANDNPDTMLDLTRSVLESYASTLKQYEPHAIHTIAVMEAAIDELPSETEDIPDIE